MFVKSLRVSINPAIAVGENIPYRYFTTAIARYAMKGPIEVEASLNEEECNELLSLLDRVGNRVLKELKCG